MNNGWITLHRKMLHWEWFDDSNTFHLFMYCLLRSNHEMKDWRGYEINRGQFITSQAHMAKDTGLSIRKIRTSLDKLKATGELTVKTNNKFSIISITNYSEYQDVDRQGANKRQADDRQPTTNNHYNNDNHYNKEKKNSRFAPPSLAELKNYINEKQLSIDAENFISFYESNGWKVGKNKMKDWKASARGWHTRNKNNGGKNERDNKPKSGSARFMENMRNTWND